MHRLLPIGFACCLCVSLLLCVMSLVGCGTAIDVTDIPEPQPFDIVGVGLTGAGEPAFDSVQRSTTLFLGGTSLIDVYVPADAGSDEAYPVIVLLQGARVDKSFYSNYAARISAHGFVVAVGNFPGPLGLFTSTANVDSALAHLADRADDPADALHDRIDFDRLGLIGHSFGGATALTFVQGDCSFPFCSVPFEKPAGLRAAAVYGARLSDFSSEVIAIDAEGVALQLMVGTVDGVSDPVEVGRTFEAITNGSKQFIEIIGGNHFAINDSNNPVGAAPDPNTPQLSQATGIAFAADWVGVFMRAHVAGDTDALGFLFSTPGADDAPYNSTYIPPTIQPSAQPRMPSRANPI